MKIQLASDLHLEFLQKRFPGERIIAPHPDADVLVLAGDIASGTQAMALFTDWPVPVVYVAGNHEFYRYTIEEERLKMQAALPANMHFLENSSAEFHGVRFLGTTLWTDYKLREDVGQEQQMVVLQFSLNDHELIRTGQRRFSPLHALELHQDARKWLEGELAKPWPGKTVVVTHHGPHPLSVHPRFADSEINAGFVSDLSDILLSPYSPTVWMHGHVHDGFDYTVGSCRVVANPAGYIHNFRHAENTAEFTFENEEFRPDMLVEV